MEVHNISIDDNEADTSGDDLEDDEHDVLFKHFVDSDKSIFMGSKNESSSSSSKSLTDVQTYAATFTTPNNFQRQFTAWERPCVDMGSFFYSSSEQPEPFHFFLLDTVSTVSYVKHPEIILDSSIKALPLHNVIRLFGVTTQPKVPSTLSQKDDGFADVDESQYDRTTSISVCCNVHGFLPYFYVLPIITNFDDVEEETYWRSEEEQAEFEMFLNENIKNTILEDISCIEYHDFVAEYGKCIGRIEAVNAPEVDGIYNFFESSRLRGNKGTLFLKVYCTLPRFIWTANSMLTGKMYKNWKFECYEANLNNTVRFLTDRNMTGCSWYELNANQYYVRKSGQSLENESHCQIEVDVHFNSIFPLEDSHARYKFNPAVRVLSFDIEVLTSPEDLTIPCDGRRQVIQIGAVLGNYYAGGNAKDSTIGKTVFVIGTCDDVEDTKIVQFYVQENPEVTNEEYMEDAEASMLGAWRDFVIQMDPDIIIGYNIKKFDFPYLFDRSFVLGGRHHKNAQVLPFMGRLRKIKSEIRPVQNDLKKVHKYDEKNIHIQGRLVMDMYPIIIRHDTFAHGPGYYKLSSVAKRYLAKDEEKQDVHYTEIETLQHGTSTARNRMARYCLQDAMIPFLLLFEPVPCRRDITRYIDLYFVKSHIGGPPLRYLLNKSISYNDYFKQVRVQKNPGRARYVPDTPSPRKPPTREDSSSCGNQDKFFGILENMYKQSQNKVLYGTPKSADV